MHILVTTNSDSTTQSWMRMDKKHIAQIKKIVPSAKITVVDESAHTLPKLLQTADIIIPANVNALDLRNAQKLKWIHVLSAGIDTLPQYLLDADLLITNSSGVHAIPIAEHVFTFFLMFARQIHKMHRAQIEKKEWTRDYTLPVSELHGKTILIVGLGRIGTKIGELAKVFHMQVIGVARSKHKDASVDTLITLNKLLSYIPKADFVVNALPLTKETEHIFDKTIFSKMAKVHIL